ncbi:hypothetical protein BIW11_02054 [Tropilaelaps mercedesae]|uniref:Uncharacterized protein n=1 Tax=Tropilaelaps mercedesae TaxID=418985 RepID=A0A1V9X419_9ACAR|nr:hypothetical protein BIW11_02054 [Tropilaelaps mercedesae]
MPHVVTMMKGCLAKPSTNVVSTETDPMVTDRPLLMAGRSSIEVQTDRPYVAPPKLYRETFTQTDVIKCVDPDQTLRPESPLVDAEPLSGLGTAMVDDVKVTSAIENVQVISPVVEHDGGSKPRSGRSSTQMSTGESIHAQRMSLDVSPVKERNDNKKPAEKRDGQNDAEEKDSFDSVDFNACELRAKQQAMPSRDAGKVLHNPPESETDSLGFITSQMFQKVLPFKESSSQAGRVSKQKDTLESMFRATQEGSIPETLPPFGSPNKVAKKRVSITGRTPVRPGPSNASPMSAEESQFVLPARKTLDLSDDESEDFMANIDTQFVATKLKKSSRRKNGTSVSPRKSQRGRRRMANPLLSSDEESDGQASAVSGPSAAIESTGSNDDAAGKDNRKRSTEPTADMHPKEDDEDEDENIAPLDTEDMKNLEREIENLDREMEDSKSTSSFRQCH